jgi:hypothetical protein
MHGMFGHMPQAIERGVEWMALGWARLRSGMAAFREWLSPVQVLAKPCPEPEPPEDGVSIGSEVGIEEYRI